MTEINLEECRKAFAREIMRTSQQGVPELLRAEKALKVAFVTLAEQFWENIWLPWIADIRPTPQDTD